jgi:hypothetical protein
MNNFQFSISSFQSIFKRLRPWFFENSLKIVVLLVVWSLLSPPVIVFAQEATVSATSKPVDYTLPYPGLLPDHPLYILHVLRDTIQEIMVSSPIKKAEFYQMQADKDISASQVLAQKKGTGLLASATADEGLEKYNKSLEAVVAAKKQGFDVHEITKKLVLANKKHVEVLGEIHDSVKASDQPAFAKEEEKALSLGTKAKSLLLAK